MVVNCLSTYVLVKSSPFPYVPFIFDRKVVQVGLLGFCRIIDCGEIACREDWYFICARKSHGSRAFGNSTP